MYTLDVFDSSDCSILLMNISSDTIEKAVTKTEELLKLMDKEKVHHIKVIPFRGCDTRTVYRLP